MVLLKSETLRALTHAYGGNLITVTAENYVVTWQHVLANKVALATLTEADKTVVEIFLPCEKSLARAIFSNYRHLCNADSLVRNLIALSWADNPKQVLTSLLPKGYLFGEEPVRKYSFEFFYVGLRSIVGFCPDNTLLWVPHHCCVGFHIWDFGLFRSDQLAEVLVSL